MAPNPFWRGYLKLSLVTCPVAMTPATSEAERIRFHTLNRATGNRVISRYVDAVTGDPIDESDQVKGYPQTDDTHVLLEDDEIAAVALDSSRTIDIETFTPRDQIGWIWYDKPHYLTPNDKIGEEAFSVIRDAMAATDMAGIARLVMYRRERAVMLVPQGKGIILWTLHYGDEVRPECDYFSKIDAKPDPQPTALIRKLIEARTVPWTASMVADPVQDRLLDIIASKRKGRKRLAKPRGTPPPVGNVVNIMDALKNSISSETGKRR